MAILAHPMAINDVIFIEDKVRVSDVSFSGTIGQTAALPEGRYHVKSSIDSFIAVAADPSAATTATGYFLLANNVICVHVPRNYKIGCIGASSGTLMIHPVG